MTPTAVSPTAIAGVSASCPNPEGGTCRGPLDPGTYRTLTFQPRIRNVTLEITSVHDQHPTEEYHALVQPIVDSLEFFG